MTKIDSAKAAISKSANETKPGARVVGFGYDPSRISGHLELTRDILDDETVSRGHPVYVLNQLGHVAYVNSEAFKLAGVDDRIDDPEFQKKDGKLTGVLFETAVIKLAEYIPGPSADQVISWGQKILEEWVAKGCTTICDMGIGSLSGKNDADVIKLPLQIS